ncbi:MAG: hypothetical protein IT176_05690 [Acidobacteria bacterium]|nr:hypothetical protein [Acidobacteriota bacterium]
MAAGRLTCALAAACWLLGAPGVRAQKVDALAQARTFYNERNFTAAAAAADAARSTAAWADSADLIGARAYLERYRETAAAEDLAGAHARLRRVDPQELSARERTEYIIGLGEALYFDGEYGSAAGVFESVLAGADPTAAGMRESVLEWWATAIDRDARTRPDIEREPRYERIRERMKAELTFQPGSAAASYWLAAAARGAGDLQAAWEAAQAGWVRAPLAPDHGAALRADIDRLVLTGIAPERAKALNQPVEQVATAWEAFKALWTK